MKEYLTSSENIAFRRIEHIMDLRQDSSALLLLSANSSALAKALESHFLALPQVEAFHLSSTNFLYDLTQSSEKELFYFINLYENENIDAIIKKLQFGRDFIVQYNLKIILLFDLEKYELLQERAYDFFSVNSFSYSFTDHSYTFERKSVSISEKLEEFIATYNDYKKGENCSSKVLIEMLFNIGKEAYAYSEIELSLTYYAKALLLTKKENLRFEESVMLGNIGLIYSDKGDNEEALKYLKEALEIHREIGYTQGVASALGNIGNICSDKGDNEEALKYHKEALEIFKEIGYQYGIDVVEKNIENLFK